MFGIERISYFYTPQRKIILKVLGKPSSLISHIGDRPGQVDVHISSTEKSARVLNIKPGKPFKEGLVQTIEWYKNNPKWWEQIEWMKNIKIRTKTGNVEPH